MENDQNITSVYISNHGKALFQGKLLFEIRKLYLGINGLIKKRNEPAAEGVVGVLEFQNGVGIFMELGISILHCAFKSKSTICLITLTRIFWEPPYPGDRLWAELARIYDHSMIYLTEESVA